MNNIALYDKELRSDLDIYAENEAEALGLPYEMVRSALYSPDHNGKPVFYGTGYLDILKLVALDLDLGVMKFGKFKFKFLNTRYVLENQKKWKDLINSKEIEFEEQGALTTRLCKNIAEQGQAMVKSLELFHQMTIEQIIATPKTADLLAEFAEEDHVIYVPKDLPLLQSCHVDWEIVRGKEVMEVGESCYFVDYSKTKLNVRDYKGVRKGAASYLPGTMVTRTKIAAHQYAFGQSASYLLKLRKFRNCELKEEMIEEISIIEEKVKAKDVEDDFLNKKRAMFNKASTREEIIDVIKELS